MPQAASSSSSAFASFKSRVSNPSVKDGFRTALPDLAILDIKMPRMDGVETLRRLREKSDLPVIFLTSKDEEMDELVGLKMGADDYIRKPFSHRLLVERVKVLLRRASPKEVAPASGQHSPGTRRIALGSGAAFLHLEKRGSDAHGHRISYSAGAGE